MNGSLRRVWVTGAAGFVGSHVVRLLHEAGCEVAAQVSPRSSLQRLDDLAAVVCLVRGDLADRKWLRTELQRFAPHAIIHLAWYTEPGKFAEAPENLDALHASLGLLEEAVRLGCPRVVMAGSQAEYAACGEPSTEESRVAPETLYARTKFALWNIGQRLAANAGIQFAWARPFFIYGPAEDERRFVPGLIGALLRTQSYPLTPGGQVRDYLHVQDVASALATLAQSGASGVYNVCSGEPVSIRQMAETLGSLLSRLECLQFGALPYRSWEPMFIVGNNARLRGLGWAPRFSLGQGLRDTVAWWQRDTSAT